MLKTLLNSIGKPSAPAGAAGTKLNVGCGRRPRAGWVNLDSQPLAHVDVVADLDRCRGAPLPFADDTFEALFASHVLEHLHDPLGAMQELHRVARPGARFEIRVPHGASDEADLDPTHVKRYFPRSFQYFCQPRYRDYDYGYRGDWDTERIQLVVAAERYAEHTDAQILDALGSLRNVVSEMRVFLRAVKPIRSPDHDVAGAPVLEILRGVPREED